MSCSRSMVCMAAVWLVVAAAVPVRRSPDLEARRRSAIDRSMIRFGRSYPAEPSAADLREAFERPSRGNSFLRFGRSQPLTLTSDDLVALLRAYEEDFDAPSKKSASFIRFGRDPAFIRFGRSNGDENVIEGTGVERTSVPLRKSRARNHFIRLGRDSEEASVEEEEESRKKREACYDCE